MSEVCGKKLCMAELSESCGFCTDANFPKDLA